MIKGLLFLVSIGTIFGITNRPILSRNETNNTTLNCDHDFDYFYDYTKYPSYSNEWKQDVFETNFMTISPQQSVLGVGQQNVACDGTGYLIYKYTAPNEKAFNSLTVHIIGRVFHNIDSGKCADGTCDCGLSILVSNDNINYTEAGYEEPSLLGATRGFRHELTPYIHGNDTVYVKLLLHGLSWDWVHLASVNIYGTYCSNQTLITNVNVHNATNTRMHRGEVVNIDVTVKNNTASNFNGELSIYAPTYYFNNIEPLNISLNANSQNTFTISSILLEGGYNNFFVMLRNSTNLLDQYEITSFARGEGTYLIDGHSHSFVSDGRNSFLDHYTQAHEKGLSGALSTDHDAPLPNDDTDIKNAAKTLSDSIEEDFIALKGSEETSSGNFHILCYNYGSEYPSLMDSQQLINGVISEGGYAYLAHPFLPGYSNRSLGTDPTHYDALEYMTGVELYNGESTEARGQDQPFVNDTFEYFDRINITGKKKYYGIVGSDAHDSILIGNVVNALSLDDLTDEAVIKTLGTGKSYVTTGAELRFSIDDKTFGESVRVRGSKTSTLHIEAFDPNSPITKVVLYKYLISEDNNTAYTNGQNNALVLYDNSDSHMYHYIYDNEITVEENSFYRVEVITKTGSLAWAKPEYYGFAKSNPIWIEKEISSLSTTGFPTNTEVEQYGKIDTTGFQLIATYYDGTTKNIKEYRVSDIDTSKLGSMTVTFIYEDNSFFVTYNVVEEQGVFHIQNGTIDYYEDFSKFPAYSKDWVKDSGADSTSGYLTIVPSEKGLGIGKQNVQSYGRGNVDYRIQVPDGNVINALTMDLTGRIYHSTSNSKCSSGTCTCCFKVLISLDGGCNFDLAYDYDVGSGRSSWNQSFHIDLNDKIGTSKCVIVRIIMDCQSWDWICISTLRMNGTYIPGESIPIAEKGDVLIGGGSIKYEKNYTSYPQYDNSWKDEKAVFETGGNLTISPSTRCLGVGKQNVSSAGSGYVSYLVDVKKGNIITSLNFSATGRIYHSSSNAECANEKCTCAFKIYICTDEGYIYKEVYNHPLNYSDSKFNTTVSVDLTEYIKDKQRAIIKMYMSGKSWDWIGITDVNISGTYTEGKCIPNVIVTDAIDQEYYLMGTYSDEWKKYAYSYKDICVGAGDKPWLGIDPGEGGFNGKKGEVVYKVDSTTGAFADLSISGIARVFTYQGSEAYLGISISFDGVSYINIKEFDPTTNGDYLENFNISLTDYIKDKPSVYIKIEIISGLWDWVCLKELHIIGYSISTYVPLTIIDSFGNTLLSTEEFIQYTGVNLSDYEKRGYIIEGLYSDNTFKNKIENNITGEYETVYLNYEIITYQVRYHNTDLSNGEYTVESEFVLPTPEVPEGKSFQGWYLSEDFEGEAITKIDKGSIGDLDLYAKFVDSQDIIDYRESKINELINSVDLSNYREAEKTVVTNILNNAIANINKATSKTSIDKIVADAKNEIATYKTEEDYQLIAFKESAISELNIYLDQSLYRDEEKQAIKEIINEASNRINNATSKANVTDILTKAKTDLDNVRTAESFYTKTGCGGSIIAISPLLTVLTLAGIVICYKRRKES